jgi:phage baseplate assembly protein W
MTHDYGTDLSVTDDFAADFHMSSGRRLLAEACVRRLLTPLGQLRRHPMYGYDVRDEIGDDVSKADLARVSANVQTQLMRDERIVQCTCTATLDRAGAMTLDIVLTDGAGPFRLVLAVSSVTVSILSGPS